MPLDWDNPVKHEHPNWFLRQYGNLMGKIAHWFLMRALPFETTYEIVMTDDEDDEHDIDWERLQFEYKRWKGDNSV